MNIPTRLLRSPSRAFFRFALAVFSTSYLATSGCTTFFSGVPPATVWNECLNGSFGETDDDSDCDCPGHHGKHGPGEDHGDDFPSDEIELPDAVSVEQGRSVSPESHHATFEENRLPLNSEPQPTSEYPDETPASEQVSSESPTSMAQAPFPSPQASSPKEDAANAESDFTENLRERLSTDLWVFNTNLRDDGQPGKLADNFHRRHFDKAAHLNNAKRGATPQAPKEYSESVLSHYRWYHRDIENLEMPFRDTASSNLSHEIVETESVGTETVDPEAVRLVHVLEPLLRNKDAVLRCNAAILRLRLRARIPTAAGINRAKLVLLASIMEETLSPGQRAAAAETLTLDEDSVSVAELAALLETCRKSGRRQTKTGGEAALPIRLHIELLHALGKRIPPWQDDGFRVALEHPVKEVRLEAVRHWQKQTPVDAAFGTTVTLPREMYVLARSETETAVYIEVVKTLAVWRDPVAIEILRTAGQHPYVDVRCCALEAFGQIGGEESLRHLREGVKNTVPRVRAAALRGLRHAGQYGDIYRVGGDKSVEVRTEVARTLADRIEPKSLEIAKKYCSDISGVVVKETAVSLEHWPPEIAVPLLLDMLAGRSPTTRAAARDSLIRKWPAAETVFENALADPLADPVAELKKRFYDEYPHAVEESYTTSVVQAAGRGTTSSGTHSRPFSTTLNQVDREQIRESLDDLAAEDLMLRQRGAAAVYVEASAAPLTSEAILAVCDAVAGENDAIVLTRILSALAVSHETAPPLPIGTVAAMNRLAMSRLRHSNTEVRKKACAVLGARATLDGLDPLLETLNDPHPEVVRAAIAGLGALSTELSLETLDRHGRLTGVQHGLAELQRHASPTVRVDAAVEGFLLGDTRSRNMLGLLAASREEPVRLYLARRLAETAGKTGETFVPEMLRFLDDKSALRRVALDALPEMCGVSLDASLSPTEQAEYWKNRAAKR